MLLIFKSLFWIIIQIFRMHIKFIKLQIAMFKYSDDVNLINIFNITLFIFTMEKRISKIKQPKKPKMPNKHQSKKCMYFL